MKTRPPSPAVAGASTAARPSAQPPSNGPGLGEGVGWAERRGGAGGASIKKGGLGAEPRGRAQRRRRVAKSETGEDTVWVEGKGERGEEGRGPLPQRACRRAAVGPGEWRVLG